MKYKNGNIFLRRNAVKFMSLLVLLCVYAAVYIILPDLSYKNVSGKGNISNGTNLKNGDENVLEEYKKIDLSEKIIVIDSGHGGFDSGKKSLDGTLEKDINLSVAFMLKELLENNNAKIVMTRTDDSGLYKETDSNKKIADMKKRCDIIKEANADMVVSIHQNSYQSPSVKGAQMFYYKHSVEGKKLAAILQKTVKEELDPDNKRLEKPDSTYYMLVHTSAPTVIAECGFLSNPDEAALLKTKEYQKKVAVALYKGIINYLGNGENEDGNNNSKDNQ